MSNSQTPWFSLDKNGRKKEILRRRIDGKSFSEIAEELLGTANKKSTIWSWAQRNMNEREIYPQMEKFPRSPTSSLTDTERRMMYEILSSLYPRLDAQTEHLLVEIQKIHAEQREKFNITAGFLDELEKRIIESIRRNTAAISSSVSRVVTPSSPSILHQNRRTIGVPPPPPPPKSSIPSQYIVGTGTMAELRTDFEEMSIDEISALSPDVLESLTPSDRNRIQERVKELRRIDKMSHEERIEYLRKKQEEKERTNAVEGLGASLTSMLDEEDSLFARMRRAADDSEVTGTGTFGKFTTEFNYFYCFACGKMNRSEDEKISLCEYCSADENLLVLDEIKSNFTYWECLSEKFLESVDLSYNRGKQIVVKSRWKVPVGEPVHTHSCKSKNIREITSSVLVKSDPDKEFSYFLTLFRMYTQLNLKEDLKKHISELYDEIQKLPDIISKESAISEAIKIINKIEFLLKWIINRKIIDNFDDAKELVKIIDNLFDDMKALRNPESPQELHKASELGFITGKIDQLLNRFSTIFVQLESELIIPSKWKCSECGNIFLVKDRHQFPECCTSCGKIITKLESV